MNRNMFILYINGSINQNVPQNYIMFTLDIISFLLSDSVFK